MDKFSFKNIVGNENKIERLKKISAEKNFPHAVIFSGAKGIGKRKIAETCAAVLLCENISDGEPCGECLNCRTFLAGSHPDFLVIEPEESKAAPNIKIGQIRDLQSAVSLKPVQAERRVVIIDGAEFMNTPAANCLLKTIEEPPGQTIFILITSNRAGLLMTIRSRCMNVNFDKIPDEEIKNFLQIRGIDNAEKISLISEGSIGRALNLAEFGGYEVREIALDFIERLCREEITNEDIFLKGEQFGAGSRENFGEFVVYVQKILRDICLKNFSEPYNSDLRSRLEKIKIPDKRLYRMIDDGAEIYKRLKSNANLRLLAESYLMRLKKILMN